MTDIHQDFIHSAVAKLIHAFVVNQLPVRTAEDRDAKTQADTDTMVGLQTIASQTLIDLNRCADALERIAVAQEGRIEIERVKAGLMKNALTTEPQKVPGIIRGIPT